MRGDANNKVANCAVLTLLLPLLFFFFWEGAAVSEAYSLAPRQDKGKQNLLQAATFL